MPITFWGHQEPLSNGLDISNLQYLPSDIVDTDNLIIIRNNQAYKVSAENCKLYANNQSQIDPNPSVDPYLNNVVLFLKGEGTNGSTNIVDSSLSSKTISVFGNTRISTAQSKYGGSSLYFDGNGDYLTTTSSNTLQDSDYTMEGWVYVSSTSGTQAITSTAPAVVSRGIVLKIQDGFLGFESGGGNPNLISSLAVTANQFNHLALSKQGNNYIFAVNGVTQSIANATALSGHGTMHIGSNARLDFAYFLNGYIDSLRVTEGVARYTTTFNPETDTYLN